MTDPNNNRTPLGAALKQGVDTISYNQEVEFTLYRRFVLPYDGYVYWVRDASAAPLVIMGSLHYNSDLVQTDDNTQPTTRIVFTSQEPVRDFTEMDPQTLYMAWFEGNQFAFASLAAHYQQADLWHYIGKGTFSEYANLIVDDISQVPTVPIISNSLPSWLAMNDYNPPWHVDIPFPPITLYPAFLSPMNMEPPYGTIMIEPEQTTSYALAPMKYSRLAGDMLAHDRVTVTMYGATNLQAQNFLAAVNQYTLDTEQFGIVGVPAIMRDDVKATVPETLLLAEKKHIAFEVSYLHSAQRDVARQLIEKVIVTVVGVDTFVSGP